MNNEDSAPSPADGPAKVFGREWVSIGEGYESVEIDLGPLSLTCHNGVWCVDMDEPVSTGNPEQWLLSVLSALLSLVPPEQVVSVMNEDTLTATWNHAFAEARTKRDEALARAEKAETEQTIAEEKLRAWSSSDSEHLTQFLAMKGRAEKAETNLLAADREWYAKLQAADAYAEEAQKRAEQAERERDAMHAAAEELRAQGAELGENLAVKDLVQYPGCTGVGRVLSVRTRSGEGATEYQEVLVQWPDSAGEYVKPVWDRSARLTRLPADLCLIDDGRGVRTMAPNEVRDVVTGKAMPMNIMRASSGTEVFIECPEGDCWVWPESGPPDPRHPCSLPSNRLRVEAFLKDHHESAGKNNSPNQRTDDSAPRVRSEAMPNATVPRVQPGDAAGAGQSEAAAWQAEMPKTWQASPYHAGLIGCRGSEEMVFAWDVRALVDRVNAELSKVRNGTAAVLPEAHSGSPSGELSAPCRCGKCPGYRFTPDGKAFDRDCPACNGTGRKTEESDAQGVAVDGQAAQPKATAASVHEEPATGATERAQPSASGAPIVGDGADPVVLAGAGAVGGTSGPAPGDVPSEVTRPIGVPASATIWAEVVDGLGRKVGAWFKAPFMKCDLGHVEMYDPEQPSAPWAWSPRCDSQWKGDFDKRLTPSAAAQCRQLYERGMAEIARESKPSCVPAEVTKWKLTRVAGIDAALWFDGERVVMEATDGGPRSRSYWPSKLPLIEDAADVLKAAWQEWSRPPCIPTHIADTDWTVIEGRAVWREQQKALFIASSDRLKTPWANYQSDINPSLAMQCDVPQSLFLAARRWMEWEPTLTPVDLTELREAWKAYREPMPGGELRHLLAAVEKLLSSGGAP